MRAAQAAAFAPQAFDQGHFAFGVDAGAQALQLLRLEGAKVGLAHVIGLGSACGIHILEKSAL